MNVHGMQPRKALHIFNGFMNPHGGSELEALELYRLLREQGITTSLWATSSRASATLKQQFPIHPISMTSADRPAGGNYVFVGAHWRNKLWPYFVARPERLIYVYNTFHPKILALTSRPSRLLRWPRTEYVVISEFQKSLLRLDAQVHPSAIDICRFAPAPRPPRSRPVVGRFSRDTPDKHHDEDPQVYRALVEAGCAVKLQGATCIAERLQGIEQLELLPEGQLPASDFLHGLDVFYYRTGAHLETFGRVVIEAMACGLPVVCHARGGYADLIRHGENGFLFHDSAEAIALIRQLVMQSDVRARIGAAARQTVETLYSRSAQQQRLEFYLR